MIVATAYFLLDERFLPLPDFFALVRFRPPDLRAELLFLLADFRPEPRLRLLPDFFAGERFRLLPDFLAGARFLLVDLRADFLADVFLPLPDFFADARFLLLPPDFFLPPLSCLLTVRQARSSASSFDTPFFS
jgi:hypothetical protein